MEDGAPSRSTVTQLHNGYTLIYLVLMCVVHCQRRGWMPHLAPPEVTSKIHRSRPRQEALPSFHVLASTWFKDRRASKQGSARVGLCGRQTPRTRVTSPFPPPLSHMMWSSWERSPWLQPQTNSGICKTCMRRKPKVQVVSTCPRNGSTMGRQCV